ncbi:hypothetical protein ACLMJK_003810 [Lecanora helva]
MRSSLTTSFLLILARFTLAADLVHDLSLPSFLQSMNRSSLNTSIAASNDNSIQAWAKQARQSEYRENAIHQGAINTLEALFQQKVEPDIAAATITGSYEPWLKQGFAVSPVFQFWGMICEAIQMLGQNVFIVGQLVELLNSISTRPDVLDRNGRPVSPGGGYTGVYWRDLPALAVMLREYAFDIEPETPELPDEGDWTPAQRATLMSVVTFGTYYLAWGQVDLGMSHQAEVSFMLGIEQPYQTPQQIRRALTLVPPAAEWMGVGGKKIYQLCQRGTTQRGTSFSLDRWRLWRTKFVEIGRNSALTPSVRQWALGAQDSMAAAETSRTSEAR